MGRTATDTFSRGARFLRVALQVNSYPYLVANGIRSMYASEADYNAAIVAACRQSGVEAVAVTDHFRIQTSLKLIHELESAGIAVFPAFEAQTSDGVHVLVLFDPGTPHLEVERAIGACDVSTTAGGSPIGTLNVLQLTEKARRSWHAICIAAHVTSPGKGLLTALKGQARIAAWKAPDLYAVAIPGTLAELGAGDRAILVNGNPEYARLRPLGVINAQDVNDPADVAAPGATTLVKMSEVSVEALRQALLDPQSRIRLNSDPIPETHTQLVRVSWEGGFLDGLVVDLNENLNVLIGGRGAGKSCVIESIRYALGQSPLAPEAKMLHEAIVRNVLRSATKVTLDVEVHGPTDRSYTIDRVVPNQPSVRDHAGNVVKLLPTDLLGGMEIYGQHEISELTKSPASLTRLLDRFVSHDVRRDARRRDLLHELRENRELVLRLRDASSSLDERLAQLPALEERLRSYEAAGLEEQFKERSALVPEERYFDALPSRIGAARGAVSGMTAAVAAALKSPLGTARADQLPHAAIVAQAEGALAEITAAAGRAANAIEAATEVAEGKVAEAKTRWEKERAAVVERYEATLRGVGATRINAQAFITLRGQIEELRPQREQLSERESERASALERRRVLLVELEDLRAQEFRALADAAAKVSRDLTEVVRVTVNSGRQRDALEEHLRNRLGGNLARVLAQLGERPDLSLRELADAIDDGPEKLRETFGFTAAQAEHLAKLDEAARLELEEIELGTTTRIELNVRPAGGAAVWAALDDLSTGQKATALLLLLLLESEAPLVVDQPEDDLDNRFISEKVVPLIKQEKRRRQFLFSSHNANIPVLGDAELIIGLEATNEHASIRPEHLGSIDKASVRELASEILEGGREAFELRRAKYDF
jgi:DNA repair ATPase RecN